MASIELLSSSEDSDEDADPAAMRAAALAPTDHGEFVGSSSVSTVAAGSDAPSSIATGGATAGSVTAGSMFRFHSSSHSQHTVPQLGAPEPATITASLTGGSETPNQGVTHVPRTQGPKVRWTQEEDDTLRRRRTMFSEQARANLSRDSRLESWHRIPGTALTHVCVPRRWRAATHGRRSPSRSLAAVASIAASGGTTSSTRRSRRTRGARRRTRC